MQKKIYTNITLKCVIQNEEFVNNGSLNGVLDIDNCHFNFIEKAPKLPYRKNPKLLDGKLLSLIHRGINKYYISIKGRNPLADEHPERTCRTLCEEYMKAWKLAHNL